MVGSLVISKEQMEVLPTASVASYLIVVVPIGKTLPLDKPEISIFVIVGVPQLSVATGKAYVITESQEKISAEQFVKMGASLSVMLTVNNCAIELPEESLAA